MRKNYMTMSNGFFYEIHDDGKAPSWAFHCTGILQVDQQPTSSMMMAELNLELSMGMGILSVNQQQTSSILNVRAPSWFPPEHGHLISLPAANLLHDNDRTPFWTFHGHRHLYDRSTSSRPLPWWCQGSILVTPWPWACHGYKAVLLGTPCWNYQPSTSPIHLLAGGI